MGCYITHILTTRRRLQRSNIRISLETETELPDELQIQRHWTRWMYTTCCYINSLDSKIEEEGAEKKTQDMQKQQASVAQLPMRNSTSPVNHSLDHITLSKSANLGLPNIQLSLEDTPFQGYHQWILSTFIWAMVFKIVLTLFWFFLQGFIQLQKSYYTPISSTNSDADCNLGCRINQSIVAFAFIVAFQLFRTIFINLLIVINSKLPTFLEHAYFAQFAVQTMFFFYYRNLFITFSDWNTTIVLNIVVFIFNIIIYPVNMSRPSYNFRFRTLKRWISGKKFLSCLIPVVDGDVITYEKFTKDLAVEYYYDKVSDYYSLITFVLFLTIYKFGLSIYNGDYFASFNNFGSGFYNQLMYRYLFILGFEIITDAILRHIMARWLSLNVSNLGRNATIYNYRARFLFTVFMIYFLADIYYSLITPDALKKFY